jgi:hypothetical protein
MGFARADYRKLATSTPIALWRNDLRASLTVALLFSSGSWAIIFGFADRLSDTWAFAPIWLFIWLVAAFAAGRASQLYVASLIRRIQGLGPVRAMRFLEDARDREVLHRRARHTSFGTPAYKCQRRLKTDPVSTPEN